MSIPLYAFHSGVLHVFRECGRIIECAAVVSCTIPTRELVTCRGAAASISKFITIIDDWEAFCGG